MKIIVSPGLARSGTTYTSQQITRHGARFINPPFTKESNVFVKDVGPKDILGLSKSNAEHKYYIDYSPIYLSRQSDAISRIVKLECSTKKIILHLRHPVDQIFAHYLHDISTHISTADWGDDSHWPLFGTKSMARYFFQRRSAISQLIDGIGRENILVVNFHKDLPDPAVLRQKLTSFLDIPLNPFDSQPVGQGGWLPHYIYGGFHGTEIAIGDRFLRIPSGGLLLVNGPRSLYWSDVPERAAAVLMTGASGWTRSIEPEQFDVMYDCLRSDWEGTLDLLGEDPADYPVTKRLVADRPILPAEKVEQFGLAVEPLAPWVTDGLGLPD